MKTISNQKNSKQDIFFILLAVAMASFYFLNLPFNAENSTKELMNNFFGADCWRVLENIKDSDFMSHYRDKVHPFFSLFAVTISKIPQYFGYQHGEFILYRTLFGVSGAVFFWLIIYEESQDPLLAFSSTLALLLTFSVKVWSVLPETFIFGFFTIMLSLYLIRKKTNSVMVFIASISGTITNAFIGILYSIRRHTTVQLSAKNIIITICALALLTILQKIAYPSSVSFFEFWQLNEERSYINKSLYNIPFRVFDFFYSGFLIPLPQDLQTPVNSQQLWIDFLNNYHTGYSRRLVYGVPLLIITTTALLGYAIFKFKRDSNKSEILEMLFLFICFQLFLHIVYGDTPFLYSFHFLPAILLFVVLQLPRNFGSSVLMTTFATFLFFMESGQRNVFNSVFG